jgi:cytochrome c oxidase assembly protein subunit 15
MAAPSTTPADTTPGRYRPGPHRVALAAALCTLPLLFLGGSVTSYGVGMAVPDWPTTFGANMFLYNFWHAPFGVRVEHLHRLYAAFVGLATVFLAGWFLAFEPRRSLKVLGVVALVAVIAQGIMGGLRVNQISTFLAAVHGCFGQAFFGLMVTLCVLTSRKWVEAGPRRDDPASLRLWAGVMLALVYGQVVIGAWFRHFKTLPALGWHAAAAVAVLGFAHATSARVSRRSDTFPELRPSARALGILATIQVLLGVLALVFMLPLGGNPRTPTLWQAMMRTAHQTNGALLLAAAVILMLRTFHACAAERASHPATPLSLEAVA